MSEADRVFARMTTPGSDLTPEDKQVLHIAVRRRGTAAGQSRVVEVVHRKSDRTAPPAEPANPPAQSPHAATWPEGFQARSISTPPPAVAPAGAAAAPAPPVGHVMPGWAPLLPVEPAAKSPAGSHRPPRVARPERSADQPKPKRRGFADPFAADDTGTNCLRCGYRISPAREKRGLLICTQCR